MPHWISRLVVKNLGIGAAREAVQKKVLDIKFEPKGDTSLSDPKYGKDDPDNKPHTGGNTWAGGVRAVSYALLCRYLVLTADFIH